MFKVNSKTDHDVFCATRAQPLRRFLVQQPVEQIFQSIGEIFRHLWMILNRATVNLAFVFCLVGAEWARKIK